MHKAQINTSALNSNNGKGELHTTLNMHMPALISKQKKKKKQNIETWATWISVRSHTMPVPDANYNESNAKMTQKTGKNKNKSVSFWHAHITMHMYECLQFRRIIARTTITTNRQIADKSFLIWRPLRPRQQQLTVLVERQRQRERGRESKRKWEQHKPENFAENRQFLPIPASFHKIHRLA